MKFSFAVSLAAIAVNAVELIPTDTLVSRSLLTDDHIIEARGGGKGGHGHGGHGGHPDPKKLFNITLFHTNDVHAHLDTFRSSGLNCTNPAVGCFGGYPAIKATVDALRPKQKNSLLLNMGDEFQGTMYFQFYGGEKIAETINQLGFDAFVIGNHEFDRGPDHLAAFLNNLTFPTLCANIASNNTALARNIVPYKIFPQYELAIIGITTDTIPSISSPGPNTTFTDPIATVQRVINKLKKNSKVKRIIAMTHIGYDLDRKMAQETTGLNVIIGGHSHTPLGNFTGAVGAYPTIETNKDGEEVFVVTAYRWGEYLGFLQLSYDESKIVAYSGAPIHMTNATVEDPSLKAQVRKWAEPFAEFSNRVVGQSTVVLNQANCQQGECVMGDLIADVMQWYRAGETAGAIINAGGIRATIDAGDITVGDVLTTFPFSNAVTDISFTGDELWKVFEGIGSDVSLFDGLPVTSFVQVSSEFKIVYDSAAPVGSRLQSLSLGGTTITAGSTEIFKIATVDFLATGGDNFWEPKSGFVTLQTLDEVIISYLAQSGPISPAIDGRITV